MPIKTKIRLGQLTGSFNNVGDNTGPSHIVTGEAPATMAVINAASSDLSGSLSHIASAIGRIHGRASGEFANNAAGTFYVDVVPDGDGTRDLGNASNEWAQVHTNRIDSAAALDINVTTGLTIDATTMSIDGTDDSNLTVTSSGKDLDIAVAGGGAQELRLTSAGTGANAIHLNASAGGINIDSADMIDVDAADEITLTTTSADGHISLVSAHTAGVALHIDCDANVGSIVDIDAGELDIDASGGINIATAEAAADAFVIDVSGNGGMDITVGNAANDANANLDIVVMNKLNIDVQGTDAADGVEITLGGDNADAKFIVQNNSGGDALVVDGNRDVSVGRNLTITGDLTVNGATTTVSTTNLDVEDAIIMLQAEQTGGSTTDMGLIMERGTTGNNAAFIWDEGADKFLFGTTTETGADTDVTVTLGAISFAVADVGTAGDSIDINNNDLRLTADRDIRLQVGSSGQATIDIAKGNDLFGQFMQLNSGKTLVVSGSSKEGGNFPALELRSAWKGIRLRDDANSKDLFDVLYDANAQAISMTGGGTNTFQISSGKTQNLVLNALEGGFMELGLNDANGAAYLQLSGSGINSTINVGGAQGAFESTGGELEISGSALSLNAGNSNTPAKLKFFEDANNGTAFVSLRAPATITSNSAEEYQLPDGLPTSNGYVLASTTAGVMSWVAKTSAGNAVKSTITRTAPLGAQTELDTNVNASAVAAADAVKVIDIYVNGQLLSSGSGAYDSYNGANGDYHIDAANLADVRVKFAFDLENDDVITVVARA